MRRLLLISLAALPLAAQYPAGAVFHRGDDPRWADPNFDDRQWVKQSDYRANSYDDYLQNRSWMRARVTIPAGEPAVIVSQHCPCEFYVNGIRVAAIGDLNQPRPHTPRRIRNFLLPAGIRMSALARALLPQLAAQAALIVAVIVFPQLTRWTRPAEPEPALRSRADTEHAERLLQEAFDTQPRGRDAQAAPGPAASER